MNTEISEELDHLVAENAKHCQIVKQEMELIEAEVAKAKEKERVCIMKRVFVNFEKG